MSRPGLEWTENLCSGGSGNGQAVEQTGRQAVEQTGRQAVADLPSKLEKVSCAFSSVTSWRASSTYTGSTVGVASCERPHPSINSPMSTWCSPTNSKKLRPLGVG